MSDWIAPTVGASLLLLLALDVFKTAFHAEGRGGPINRYQNRLIWAAARRFGCAGNRARAGVLSQAGPLMAVITVVVWTVLFVTAFALVYLPFIDVFHYSPGSAGPPPLEALYYSGIMASTLGQGDVVAPYGWLRVATIVQAITGFAAVTVAVTYVLAVYRELVKAQTLAAAIDARLSHRDGDRDEEHDGAVEPDSNDVAEWDRTLALRITAVIESHHNYPILHYFRPRERGRSVPYQVARLFSYLRAQEAGPAAGDRTGSASVSRSALRAALGRYIDVMHDLFVRPDGAGTPDQDDGEAGRLRDIVSMLCHPWPGEEDGG